MRSAGVVVELAVPAAEPGRGLPGGGVEGGPVELVCPGWIGGGGGGGGGGGSSRCREKDDDEHGGDEEEEEEATELIEFSDIGALPVSRQASAHSFQDALNGCSSSNLPSCPICDKYEGINVGPLLAYLAYEISFSVDLSKKGAKGYRRCGGWYAAGFASQEEFKNKTTLSHSRQALRKKNFTFSRTTLGTGLARTGTKNLKIQASLTARWHNKGAARIGCPQGQKKKWATPDTIAALRVGESRY